MAVNYEYVNQLFDYTIDLMIAKIKENIDDKINKTEDFKYIADWFD